MTYRFNYKEISRDDFTALLFVNLMTGARADGKWEDLQALTNNWSNIELSVSVNGMTLDMEDFLRSLERRTQHLAEEHARELLSLAVPELDGLQDTLDALADSIKARVRKWAIDNNMPFDPYGELDG